MSKKAVILLSGGLDSATLMAMAKQEGYELYPITFCYGQKHGNEINSAKKIASLFKAKEHMIFDIDLKKIGGSSLTNHMFLCLEHRCYFFRTVNFFFVLLSVAKCNRI